MNRAQECEDGHTIRALETRGQGRGIQSQERVLQGRDLVICFVGMRWDGVESGGEVLGGEEEGEEIFIESEDGREGRG